MQQRQKKMLVISLLMLSIIVLVAMLYLLMATDIGTLEIGPSDQTLYGEVWGGFDVNGPVHTDQQLKDVGFLVWTYEANDNVSSYFALRVWNVTNMMVWSHANGTEAYTNYTMANESLTVVAKRSYFTCQVRSARLRANFSEINAINDDGDFERNQNWTSLHCEGELDHVEGMFLDFFLDFSDVRIGNRTFYVGTGRFAFPDDEYARFELTSMGRGLILPTPTLVVDGEVRFDSFRQIHEDGTFYRNIEHLTIRSSNVTISTRQEPYCYVRDHETDVYVVKWIVMVRVSKS